MSINNHTFPLSSKKILLGITGSIASYKSAELASELVKMGADVHVMMTKSALNFIGTETFKGLTHNEVFYDLWSAENKYIEHINLGLSTDCMVIAPCTANTIAKIALGIADDPVSTTALTIRNKLLIAPAMDGEMYNKFSTQNNIKLLKKSGVDFIGPNKGRLASGINGIGRMADINEISGYIRKIVGASGDYKNKHVVVSAGGTIEPIDPVRHISNKSTGLMGFSIAEAARDRGAKVTLITSSKKYNKSSGINILNVSNVESFKKNITNECIKADLLVMAAAISDFKPTKIFNDKIKKNNKKLSLDFEPVKNWLDEIPNQKILKVLFAAETSNIISNAKNKLGRKNVPFIVANDVSKKDIGFGSKTNQVTFIWKNGEIEKLPKMSKLEVGHEILDRSIDLIRS